MLPLFCSALHPQREQIHIQIKYKIHSFGSFCCWFYVVFTFLSFLSSIWILIRSFALMNHDFQVLSSCVHRNIVLFSFFFLFFSLYNRVAVWLQNSNGNECYVLRRRVWITVHRITRCEWTIVWCATCICGCKTSVIFNKWTNRTKQSNKKEHESRTFCCCCCFVWIWNVGKFCRGNVEYVRNVAYNYQEKYVKLFQTDVSTRHKKKHG